MKTIKKVLNQLVGFVKDVHFVGIWKYWKGFRPATRVLKHREELYPESGGISTQAMAFGNLGRQMRRFEEDCSEAITENHRSRRVEAIIASQPGNRRRYPRKEFIAA